CDDSVRRKRIRFETSIEGSEGNIVDSAVRRATVACRPYWGGTSVHDAVGEDEALHPGIDVGLIANHEKHGWRERCNVVDRDILEDWSSWTHGNLCKFTRATVLCAVDVIDDHIMDTVPCASSSCPSIIRQSIGDLHSCGDMADHHVANCDVRDLAVGTEISPVAAGLILRGQQDGEAHLRETTPRVLHNIAIEQDALRVFQFEEILDDEWISVLSAHVSGLSFHPCQRLEHVVTPNLDIG